MSRVNATFVLFLGALLIAPEEQENMTLNEVHQTGKGESKWPRATWTVWESGYTRQES